MTSSAEPAERLTMGRTEWAMLLALSVLWGGSFLFVGIAVAELPTLTLVWLRVALAALVLWGAVAATGRVLPRAPRVWPAFLGMGLLNNVIPFSLIVAGQHSIASGLASILNATTPLFTVVVACLLLTDERPGGLKLCGVAAGLAGVAVMIGPDALAGLGTNALAQLAVLGGALSYACAAVFGRRFRRMGGDPLVTAAGQVGAATLLLSPAMLIADRPWTLPMPGAAICAAVLGLAVLSTALAYLLYFRILARAGATSLSLVTFLIPVSAVLLGGLVLGERLAPTDCAGMACIALGLAAVDGRIFRR
ncbi:DMT family transporter [Rhodovulum sp. MB263]|uniref:DMT family transporter n=1 Tax=Rhodovulum sp. (strain MB263) TaxID=308754 RepID=UPI001E317C68|nr:DMT family transporter [Rhodovulum sp. MB263]